MHKPGFTLIELLLSFAIFAMLATGTTLALTAVLRSTARASLQAKVRNEGEYLVETIAQMTRYSARARCTSGGVVTTLFLAPPDLGSVEPRFTCAEVVPGAIPRRYWVASNAVQINSVDVEITECALTCTVVDGEVSKVRFRLSLEDKNNILSSPLIFDTDIVLRNAK
jgi:prepilin-type N-terminal cleavage/methylation domain-containing protein